MLAPLKDNVLIAALDDPDVWYESSLIIRPDATKDRSDQGIVKAIGPEVKDIQVGDYVVFPPYGGTVIDDSREGYKLVLVKEETIKAIVVQEDTPVPGLFILVDDQYHETTAEVALLIVREAYHKIPRVIEQKEKWEGRLAK